MLTMPVIESWLSFHMRITSILRTLCKQFSEMGLFSLIEVLDFEILRT